MVDDAGLMCKMQDMEAALPIIVLAVIVVYIVISNRDLQSQREQATIRQECQELSQDVADVQCNLDYVIVSRPIHREGQCCEMMVREPTKAVINGVTLGEGDLIPGTRFRVHFMQDSGSMKPTNEMNEWCRLDEPDVIVDGIRTRDAALVDHWTVTLINATPERMGLDAPKPKLVTTKAYFEDGTSAAISLMDAHLEDGTPVTLPRRFDGPNGVPFKSP